MQIHGLTVGQQAIVYGTDGKEEARETGGVAENNGFTCKAISQAWPI